MTQRSFVPIKCARRVFAYLIFLFFLFSYVNAQDVVLTVQNEQGQTLLELPLTDTATWIMRWNHSVTGVTVSDYYYWDGYEMILTDSHTPSFDAGLGHIPDRGRLVSDGLDGYFIFDIDEAVANSSYVLRVGSKRVNHRIVHAGQTYSLSDLVENQKVFIQVVLK